MEKQKTSSLYYYAEQYRKNITEEEKIELINMTDLFWEEIRTMILNKELVMININGKVRGAKSTNAMAIGKRMWTYLQEAGQRQSHEKFTMNNIARDEQEYSDMMRNPNTKFTVIVTDESNELENTGENVTAERALRAVFSNVQASRYVHRVSCSPKELVDQNADILLTCVSLNRKTGQNLCKLYYKYVEGLNEHTQLLGHVYIDVNDTIKNWIKIEPTFYKPNKTEKEQIQIELTSKKDYYVEYMIKKHEKMELITREGIFRPRMLTYAEAILTVVKSIIPLTKAGVPLSTNIIKNYIKMEMRERKIPLSIVGEELSTREAQGLIEMHKSYQKYLKELQKHKNDPIKTIQIEEVINAVRKSIHIMTSELEKYATINKKYHNNTNTQHKQQKEEEQTK